MARGCCCLIVLFGMIGCGNPTAKFEEGEPAVTPQWDALTQLTSEELSMPLEMSAMNEDWDGVKQAVQNSQFQEAVDGFADSEIPAEFATEERKKAKDDAVAQLKQLIELATSNAGGDQLKAAYEAYQKALTLVEKPAPAE